MRVISKARLREFWLVHPRAKRGLDAWYQLIAHQEYVGFSVLNSTFGASVDYVDPVCVFDIGGNKYRLVAAMHFNTQICYVRYVLTHAEYDLEAWKR